MERINKIIENPLYRTALHNTEYAETGRKYCLHGFEHSADVARIGYIISLEQGMNIKKDIIYAAALLHDTGRFRQYENGTPHHEASAELAGKILPQCGFSAEETAEIVDAVAYHRSNTAKNLLGELLQKADKLSRMCFRCEAIDGCKWHKSEMNMEITY